MSDPDIAGGGERNGGSYVTGVAKPSRIDAAFVQATGLIVNGGRLSAL